MQDMIGHTQELGLIELTEVIKDTYDADVRSAVAHADYTIWHNGLRPRTRNGGFPRNIPSDEVEAILASRHQPVRNAQTRCGPNSSSATAHQRQ